MIGKSLTNNCPFVKKNCAICGRKDSFNKIICDKCIYSGLKIIKEYYSGRLKFSDISDIIDKKEIN